MAAARRVIWLPPEESYLAVAKKVIWRQPEEKTYLAAARRVTMVSQK